MVSDKNVKVIDTVNHHFTKIFLLVPRWRSSFWESNSRISYCRFSILWSVLVCMSIYVQSHQYLLRLKTSRFIPLILVIWEIRKIPLCQLKTEDLTIKPSPYQSRYSFTRNYQNEQYLNEGEGRLSSLFFSVRRQPNLPNRHLLFLSLQDRFLHDELHSKLSFFVSTYFFLHTHPSLLVQSPVSLSYTSLILSIWLPQPTLKGSSSHTVCVTSTPNLHTEPKPPHRTTLNFGGSIRTLRDFSVNIK